MYTNEKLNIKALYPGFFGDFSDDLSSKFKFIHINEDKSITTYIDKIFEHEIEINLYNENNELIDFKKNMIILHDNKTLHTHSLNIHNLNQMYPADTINRLIWI